MFYCEKEVKRFNMKKISFDFKYIFSIIILECLFSIVIIIIQYNYLDNSLSMLQSFVLIREGNIYLGNLEFQSEIVISMVHLWSVPILISYILMKDINISLIYEGTRKKNIFKWYQKKAAIGLKYSFIASFQYNLIIGIFICFYYRNFNKYILNYIIIAIFLETTIIYFFVFCCNLVTILFGYKISILFNLLLMIFLTVTLSITELLNNLIDFNVMAYFFLSWHSSAFSLNSEYFSFSILQKIIFMFSIYFFVSILNLIVLKKYNLLSGGIE